MEWERIRGQLGAILQAPVQVGKMPQQEWSRLAQEQTAGNKPGASVTDRGQLSFMLEAAGREVSVLTVEEVLLTSAERQLVELMIETCRLHEKPRMTAAGEDERRANLVKDWFYRQLELADPYGEMPDSLAAQLSMYSTKIPLLLYGDYSDNRNAQYQDLKKLLDSFFDAEIVLIPLMDKEWLILGSEQLLAESSEDRDDGGESLEESLASICSGLYEMLSSEWVGECHLSVHFPIIPAKSLMGTILQMRETMALGRTYELGSSIHLPWKLHLEKLLIAVPETEKQRFVERVLKHVDHMLDSETQSTLEQFFALDCNVSETAKKLYIHRNTLLYRLDKFKQETGLDVRNFTDAVLVKVAMLLYKVTKRK
ncbi:PucR family transcriptional regulator [Paenibacillus sp. MBLB4367]|uniref:PucR family transcriptional regulator n=1 Tax=Paenibacillus sp. MBLB4367 TaxID=3384767 RepID=UPI003907F6A2